MVPKLTVVFLLSLFCALVGPVLLPSMRLLAFAPFLVILYTRLPHIQCLWCAFGCGLLIDLLSSNLQLGAHALNYVLITLILFRIRKFFFAHKTLGVGTFYSGIFGTFLQLATGHHGHLWRTYFVWACRFSIRFHRDAHLRWHLRLFRLHLSHLRLPGLAQIPKKDQNGLICNKIKKSSMARP